jgi:hypothetical protein
MINIQNATLWLARNETLNLQGNKFVLCDGKQKFARIFSPNADRVQISKMAEFIKDKLCNADASNRHQYLELANAFSKRYSNDRIGSSVAKIFDRTISPLRNDSIFFHKDNQAAYTKWLKYGMPGDIYRKHPEFCSFLETSGLLSQMKVTKNAPFEVDGEVAIIVNGETMRWSQIKTDFEVVESPLYGEKFIVHKNTRDVYTYLDNRKGLQIHHPYITELNPTSVLTEEEYNQVLGKAREFVRPGEENIPSEQLEELNKDRTFIIQLVSSKVAGPDTNAHNLLYKRKHPYLRLIVGKDIPEKGLRKGDVIEVGFGWKNKVTIPFVSTQGQFRSPDVWEYINSDQKVVTNMPVTHAEAKALSDFTLKYHRDAKNLGKDIGFNLAKQNCSSYVRTALNEAGIKVPTEISLKELVRKISPDWVKKVAVQVQYAEKVARKLTSWTIMMLPRQVKNALLKVAAAVEQLYKNFLEMVAAFTLAPVGVVLGGGVGNGGAAFVPQEGKEKDLKPTFSNWKNWFRISSYNFNLPGVLQEWQEKQASTVIYDKPVKLTIVPSTE